MAEQSKKTAPRRKASSAKAKNKPKMGTADAVSAQQLMKQMFGNQPTNKAMENAMTQGKNQMDKIAQDAANMGREGMEAFIKSSSIFAKGFEDIIRTSVSMAQSAAEKQSQYMKEAMTTKSLNEWAEVQNKIAQASFDDFMEGTTKISEMSVKMMSECAEPINNQMTKAMRKASDSMAA